MSDKEYFAQRARTERELSEAAADPRIAAIHAEFAALYESAAEPGSVRPKLHMASGMNWAG